MCVYWEDGGGARAAEQPGAAGAADSTTNAHTHARMPPSDVFTESIDSDSVKRAKRNVWRGNKTTVF